MTWQNLPRKKTFDISLVIFLALAAASGIACYVSAGREAFVGTLYEDVGLIGMLLPKIGGAMLVAAFVKVLLPPKFFGDLMGGSSGVKGMAVATGAGILTPGGPMTSFPIVTVLRDAGAGVGALVAYVTSWSTMGLQRVFIWEIPLMGLEFAILRFLVSMPLSIVAGLIAGRFPPGPDALPGEEAGH